MFQGLFNQYLERRRLFSNGITDFNANTDQIAYDLRGASANRLDVTISGSDTIITYQADTIILEDVQLNATDITFVFT